MGNSRTDTIYYDLDEEYSVPRKEVSCGGCGEKFGHHKTKACTNCYECSACCQCDEQNLINAQEFIAEYLDV